MMGKPILNLSATQEYISRDRHQLKKNQTEVQSCKDQNNPRLTCKDGAAITVFFIFFITLILPFNWGIELPNVHLMEN